MNSFFKKAAHFKPIKHTLLPYRPITRFSTTTKLFLSRGTNLLYGGIALFFGVGGITYASTAQAEEPEYRLRGVDSYLSKEDAKVLYYKAKELDEQGRNVEALNMYREVYRSYGRAAKSSIKKKAFVAQRIGILRALEGKYESALHYLLEGFERSSGFDPEGDIHFEQYFDLSLVKYKNGEYSGSNGMFENCLEMAQHAYSEQHELMAMIHQFLGFGLYKKGAVSKGEKHLTEALKYLNVVKKENKTLFYCSCKDFLEFYMTTGDFKKALLFLEQLKVLISQETFFGKEMKERGMDSILSPFIRKYILDLRVEKERERLENISEVLYREIGPYVEEAQKINQPFHKLTKEEKNFSIHGLLRW